MPSPAIEAASSSARTDMPKTDLYPENGRPSCAARERLLPVLIHMGEIRDVDLQRLTAPVCPPHGFSQFVYPRSHRPAFELHDDLVGSSDGDSQHASELAFDWPCAAARRRSRQPTECLRVALSCDAASRIRRQLASASAHVTRQSSALRSVTVRRIPLPRPWQRYGHLRVSSALGLWPATAGRPSRCTRA
jgi:hypothetical protein